MFVTKTRLPLAFWYTRLTRHIRLLLAALSSGVCSAARAQDAQASDASQGGTRT